MKYFRKKILSIILVITISSVPIMGYAASASTKNQQVDQESNLEQSMNKFKTIYQFILNNYVGDEISEEDLMDAALKGMFDALDQYSEYYSEEEYEQFEESVTGEFGGIGVEIKKDEEYIKVLRPLKNTPGEKAGLQPNDLITAVDGTSLKDVPMQQALGLIKGEPDTTVTLTIKRGIKTFDVEIKRETITLHDVHVLPAKEVFPDADENRTKDIWVVEIASFNANVTNDIYDVLEDAQNQGIKGLIFDVRNNPGGLLNEVINVCRMLVPKGPIVHTIDKEGKMKTAYSYLEGMPFSLVVLTNGNSASAAEIFAGAIKDSGAGVLVGGTTYGKGVVQYVFNGKDDTRFKLTVEEYLTRDEHHINGVGIEPNIKVDVPGYITGDGATYHDGSTGTHVKEIEGLLSYLGCDIGTVDETYDTNTVKGVRAFEKAYGLYVDGISDLETQAAMNKALQESLGENDPVLQKGFEAMDDMLHHVQ